VGRVASRGERVVVADESRQNVAARDVYQILVNDSFFFFAVQLTYIYTAVAFLKN